ncbi:hypothetical protein H5410_027285 [Solanum commersonii]|uniref:Uncharacterized protein n=1 Tax=Solanum commersonii TaxID=4109 RepID=A0A9J5YYT4_SOLCO|nr:hypothetical protein H5410_027285 [Solanum commersonii]
MHPRLVLDREFFEEKSCFRNMIDNILLQLVGSLVKIFLDLSTIDCNDRNLDHQLLCVTSKHIKELTLKIYKLKRYTLPFGIFDCPTLTYLDVTSFMFKPPSTKALFPNLLEFYQISPSQSKICHEYPVSFILNVHFLQWLSFPLHICSKDLTICFVNFSNVRDWLFRKESYDEQEKFIWLLLLYLWSNLTRLVLSNSFNQHLGAETFPKA